MTNLTVRPDAGPSRCSQPAPRITTAKTPALPAAASSAIAMARRGQAGPRPADPVNEIVTSKTAAWL
jgi:hypothetical protein